jgi:hypothetical protein
MRGFRAFCIIMSTLVFVLVPAAHAQVQGLTLDRTVAIALERNLRMATTSRHSPRLVRGIGISRTVLAPLHIILAGFSFPVQPDSVSTTTSKQAST